MKPSVLLSTLLIATAFFALPSCSAQALAEAPQMANAADGFKAALAAGRKLFAQKKLAEARSAFESALSMARTADERADAMIGFAEALSSQYETRKRLEDVEKLPGITPHKKAQARLAFANSYTTSSDQETARAEYAKLLAIPDLPDALKAQAFLGRARSYMSSSFLNNAHHLAGVADLESVLKLEKAPDLERAEALLSLAGVHHQFGRKDKAEANLAAVLALPASSDDQKAKALMFTGNLHQMDKQGEKARAAWLQIPGLAGASLESKVGAYRSVAGSLLADQKPDEALAELEKALQLPELDGGEKASLLDNLGDLQQSRGNLAAARATYLRIVNGADSGAIQRKDAELKVGRTFAAEKNYTAAREAWEKVAGDKSTQAVEALRLIAISHAEQMDNPAARAALDRWIALPLDNYWKEDAWVLLGRIYEREKNWSGAREAFQKLMADPKARGTRRVQAVLGIIRTYDTEQNSDAALQAYGTLPAAIKSTARPSPAEETELMQYRDGLVRQLNQLAAMRGKERATLPAAVILYGAAVEIEYRASNQMNLRMELGELLLGHGMLAAAKAEFQKVAEHRDATAEQKQKASQKLKEIESKGSDAS